MKLQHDAVCRYLTYIQNLTRSLLAFLPCDIKIGNKKLCYHEEHGMSIVLSWCSLLYDISREKICWWLINHFYVIVHKIMAIMPFKVIDF